VKNFFIPSFFRVVKGSYLSLMDAIAACKPGMMYRELGNIINKTASLHGLSVVRSYCGHGIGKDSILCFFLR
jgi:methionyl aminopeptidase